MHGETVKFIFLKIYSKMNISVLAIVFYSALLEERGF